MSPTGSWRSKRSSLYAVSAWAVGLLACTDGSAVSTSQSGSGGAGDAMAAVEAGDDLRGDGSACVPGGGGQPGADGAGAGGAVGSGGGPVICAPTGAFDWYANGQRYRSDPQFHEASYTQTAADVTGFFDIHIRGDNPGTGFHCELDGRFAALPPPTGTYPIAAETTAGAFTLDCQDEGNGTGSVILSKSIVDEIEGSFAAGGTPTSTPTVTGTFAVACAAGADCSARR